MNRLDKVWFYEIRNDGFDPDKIASGGRVETPDRNDIPALLETWKAYKATGFGSAPGVEAGSLLEAGSEEPSSWWVTTERLAESGFNLGAGQWKPRTAQAASDEDPRGLVAEVLDDYKQVVSGLENLLAELTK